MANVVDRRDCVGVTVALGVSSVMVSGLASGRRVRAPLWPILPSTDTRVVRLADASPTDGAQDTAATPRKAAVYDR